MKGQDTMMDPKAMLLEVQRMMKAHKDADTPENEARLMAEISAMGGKLTRIRGKNPQRYRLRFKGGNSIEPVTLFDVESMRAKARKPDAP